jgi:septal ring factor EnvC (AmiA/AmiB activator)
MGLWLIPILLMLAAAAVLLFPASAGAAESAVVMADRLNVRPEPGTDKEPIAALNRGDRVRVVKRHDGWLEVAFGHRSGFVRHREHYIRIVRSSASEAPAGEAARVREKAAAIAEKIEEGKEALERVSRREKAVIASLDDIDRRLNQTRQRAADLSRELAGLEEKIEASRAEAERLRKEIAGLEARAAGRLAAYYKLHWLGTVHLLASADSLADMIHRKAALERIIAADEKLWSNWTIRRRQLNQTLTELASRRQEKISVEASLAGQIAQMKGKKKRRFRLLEEIRKDKSLRLASIASLKDSAEELEETLEDLRNQVAAPPGPSEPEILDLAGRKGLLPLPVRGKIVTRFGKYRNPEFNMVNFRSGIDIRADRGEPIQAVCAGRVLFAEWFKGYGNMIIVDHGYAYYTVYAHAEELFKQKGEAVDTGEVIATVGDTGSMTGPGLYFEIRHHGKPLDPSDWLNAG